MKEVPRSKRPAGILGWLRSKVFTRKPLLGPWVAVFLLSTIAVIAADAVIENLSGVGVNEVLSPKFWTR